MEKLLTVSIAAYNVELFLETTLHSLEGSTELLDKIEILIINDGSTDETVHIAEKWEKRYPDTYKVVTKENGGHGSTLNYAIQNARGKYLRMLDGDDWYDTDAFESFVRMLTHTNADLVLTPYKRIYVPDGHVEIVNRHSLQCNQEYIMSNGTFTLLENPHAAELTVKTSLLRKNRVRITEHCCYTDDMLVFFASLFSKTVIKYENNVYQYRIGIQGQSVSDEGRLHHWRDGSRVVKDILRETAPYICTYSQEKRQFVYRILCNTLSFQYNTLLLIEDIDKVKKMADELSKTIEYYNGEFSDYLMQHCIWKRFLENLLFLIPHQYLKDKRNAVVVFGAGKTGEKAVRVLLKENITVIAVLDNQEDKWGTECQGVPIVSPQNGILEKEALYFIAVLHGADTVQIQLRSMGIQDKDIVNPFSRER